QLRVLDKVCQAVDDAGNQDLIVLERALCEVTKFVGVPRSGERQYEAADVGMLQGRKDILERNVAIMRRFRIPPAHVQSDAVARDVSERLVDGCNHLLDKFDEFGNRLVLESNVPFEPEVGRIDLQQQSAACDRFVFDLECRAERSQITS